jgi:hypothetical protein
MGDLLGGPFLVWHVINRLFIGLLIIWDTGYGARLTSNKTKKRSKEQRPPLRSSALIGFGLVRSAS